MKVRFSGQFQEVYDSLNKVEKEVVQKALSLLATDLGYPSLRVKKLHGVRDIWEARASKRLRITFQILGERLYMRNVGEHDKVLKRP